MPIEEEAGQTLDLSERRSHFKTQQSTVTSRRQQAVCVRRAFKHYGSKKMPQVVLDGLNMTVTKGAMWVTERHNTVQRLIEFYYVAVYFKLILSRPVMLQRPRKNKTQHVAQT